MFNLSKSIRSIDLPQIDLPQLEAPKIDLPHIDIPDVDIEKAVEPVAAAIARIGDEIRGRRNTSPEPASIIGGIALGAVIGAVVMYFLDPEGGRRRRALVRDQLVKLGRVGGRQIEGATQGIADRSEGLMAEASTIADSAAPATTEVDDSTLEERVRSELGRVGADTGAIQISARNGQVLVEGWLPDDEADRVLDAVRAVPGVSGVIDRRSVPQA
jgi:gas vesicle protein